MKALLIDKERDVIRSYERKLMDYGFEVFTANSAEEALNLCVAVDVDVVIASADLPDMSGFDLIERITRGRDDLHILGIVMVSEDEDLPRVLQRRFGIHALLTKPVSEATLIACIERETKGITTLSDSEAEFPGETEKYLAS